MSVNNLSTVMTMISRQKKRTVGLTNGEFINKILNFDYNYDYNFDGPVFYVQNAANGTPYGLTNLDLDEETLNSIADRGLVYLPIPHMLVSKGGQKEFNLSNLDFNQTYYMTFKPISNTARVRFGIKSSKSNPVTNARDGSILVYTCGTYARDRISNRLLVNHNDSRFAYPYHNLGKPFDVYGPEHGLQALLNINLGVFAAWPIGISFEDFYNSNLLGIN